MDSAFVPPLHYDFDEQPFVPSAAATTLVVLLHAISSDRQRLRDVVAAIDKAYGVGAFDLYAPSLPYKKRFDGTGAKPIVVRIVEDLDRIWAAKPGGEYERVVLVGYSLGGLIVRRVFLAASLNPPDYAGEFSMRDDLWDEIAQKRGKGLPCEWATKVERLVLLASWDKGWSISGSSSWYNSIGLNALGAFGRFLDFLTIFSDPLAKIGGVFGAPQLKFEKPGETMLDARKGSVFICQTRLIWMAYRRWHDDRLRALYNESHEIKLDKPDERLSPNPLVVQIIGTQDDFVAPRDQIDRDVEATSWLEGDGDKARHYFLFEMPATDHSGVIDFSNALGRVKGLFRKPVFDPKDILAKREEIFIKALTLSQNALARESLNPAFFFDRQDPVETDVTDVLFVMHGIRDDGHWTQRIAQAVKAEDEAKRAEPPAAWASSAYRAELPEIPSGAPKPIVACTQTYGYFPMGSFILPWIRQQKVEWFMDLYVETRALFPRARFHYIGHSNGTYLAASALEKYPAARFGNIYFAGSVVRRDFDWLKLEQQRRIDKFHNARGGDDWVVALLPKSLEYFTDLGGGGFDGFECMTKGDADVTQSEFYTRGGHGGAIREIHWPEIAKFVVRGEKPFSEREVVGADAPFMREKIWWMDLLSRFRFGIPVAFSAVALLVLLAFTLIWAPCMDWGATDLWLLGGWGSRIWLAAFGVFLVGQYVIRPTPQGLPARALTIIFVFCALGVANFILSSLFREAAQLAALTEPHYSVAAITFWPTMFLVAAVGAVVFILRRV